MVVLFLFSSWNEGMEERSSERQRKLIPGSGQAINQFGGERFSLVFNGTDIRAVGLPTFHWRTEWPHWYSFTWELAWVNGTQWIPKEVLVVVSRGLKASSVLDLLRGDCGSQESGLKFPFEREISIVAERRYQLPLGKDELLVRVPNCVL